MSTWFSLTSSTSRSRADHAGSCCRSLSKRRLQEAQGVRMRHQRVVEDSPGCWEARLLHPARRAGCPLARHDTCRRWRLAEAMYRSQMPPHYRLAARSSCSPADAGACVLAAPIPHCQAAQAC
jgi:hypothetical protein